MANVSISDLTAASTLDGTEVVHGLQGGNSRQITTQQIADLVDVPTVPPTDLTYTAGTRVLASSTGADVTLPLVTSTDAGLAPASGGGTSNYLRADGTWATPPSASTDLTYTAGTRLLESSTGTDVTLPLVSSANAGLAPASGGGTTNFLRADGTWATPPVATKDWEILIAVSDEITALTAGTSKVTFRMPRAVTLTDVRASVTTAPTGSTLIVDINEGGVSILSTKLSIDASEKTSTTAATPYVLSDTALADDAEITIDIDQIGSTVAGAGLKVLLKGTY